MDVFRFCKLVFVENGCMVWWGYVYVIIKLLLKFVFDVVGVGFSLVGSFVFFKF